MTVDKAIEILEDLLFDFPQSPPEAHIEAVQLGIQSLKRIKKEREIQGSLYNYRLPFETKH